MSRTITFSIELGDVTEYQADVMVLKYARSFHGADQEVALRLSTVGIDPARLEVAKGNHQLVATNNGIAAPYALYVGVTGLWSFRYNEIAEFTTRALGILAQELPDAQHIAMTVHGVNTGLDETEAFLVQFKAIVSALEVGQYPAGLQKITIVERGRTRQQRLNLALEQYAATIPGVQLDAKQGSFLLTAVDPLIQRVTTRDEAAPEPVPAKAAASAPAPAKESASDIPSDAKPHAFVAMPFRKEMDDTFYYGIQKPIHEAGLLCERVDQEAVSGEIMDHVRNRIETAAVVIADLSMSNPNVYLEVGYAWGKGRPTILVIRDEKELQFDVRGQQCLTYNNSIRTLEEMLSTQLKKMILKGILKK